MKLLSVFLFTTAFLFTAGPAAADSHPSWWAYASPEATAMVGIQWENLRNSPFASAVEAELSSSGPLAFPDLECLRQAKQIVISAPELLAAEAGTFPAATVKEQAIKAGLHRVAYQNLTLWVPNAVKAMGVAQLSDQLVLVGTRKTLQEAIERSMTESGRQYSSLLPRAAHFSQTGDLWVVAVKLPDPLASLFVPIDAAGSLFLGQVSVRDGLSMEASFDAPSTEAASEIAAKLQDDAATLPEFARGLQATSDRRTVNLALEVRAEDLVEALRSAPTRPAAPGAVRPAQVALQRPVAAAMPVASKPAAEVRPVETKPLEPQPAEGKLAPQPPAPQPPGPQVVRILGLDSGPREIVLPPLPAASPR